MASNDDFTYDQAVDDFLADLPINREASNDNPAAVARPSKNVDEEIKVRKQRAPAPKLDEARLLSAAGVPQLRRIAKRKLKFKGTGHEFADVSMLLDTYQLWLDDLYPRAKFRDALTMVEKLGHTKRIQITRKAWMDGTKISQRQNSPTRVEDAGMGSTTGIEPVGDRDAQGGGDDSGDDMFPAVPRAAPLVGDAQMDNGVPDDDELDALMAENTLANVTSTTGPPPKRIGPFAEDDADSDQDELDALLAQSESRPPQPPTTTSIPDKPLAVRREVFEFDEDEEAMASMGGW